ncbi:hypothetical protein OAJ65_02690 [Flavobacteriales bacterium]|nr:hypothetical protein [Flavobacteriales bacterium]
MKKVLVLGCCGAGKSTFSKKLQSILKLPLIHLDSYYHKPNWVEPQKEEWEKVLKQILRQESFIMDGTYLESLDERIKKSDTIIYLDYSLIKCFFRVIKRVLIDFGKKRSDMAPGCKEEFDLEFLWWVLTFNNKFRKEIIQKLNSVKNKKNVSIFKTDKQADNFLAQISGS